jgi:Rrf2 family protein
MFQLSKKVEYALIAMRHMAISGNGIIVTTKEIADRYQLPYDLLAKVMQILARKGFIASYQGVRGGYVFRSDPSTVKVSAVINAIEGKENLTIVQCEADSAGAQCTIHSTCTIKTPLIRLQTNINSVLSEMSILEMV